jgi:hypothetical protein
MKNSILPFLTQIEQAIHYALQPAAIIRSFQAAGIVPLNPDLILRDLPETCPAYAIPTQTRTTHRIQISGTTLTSPEMLEKLRDNDTQREEREKKGKKKFGDHSKPEGGSESDSIPSSENDDEEDDMGREIQEIEKENTWLATTLKPVVVYDDETEFDSDEDEEESEDEEMEEEQEKRKKLGHTKKSEEPIGRRRKRLKVSTSEVEDSNDTGWLGE